MILWIVYFVMAGVILYLVIKVLRLSDEVETLENWKDFRYREFMKVSEEKEKLEQIIDNIKNTMSF